MYPVLKHAVAPTHTGLALSLVWAAIHGSREYVLFPLLTFLLSFSWVREALEAMRVVYQYALADHDDPDRLFSAARTLFYDAARSPYLAFYSLLGWSTAQSGYRCLPCNGKTTFFICVSASVDAVLAFLRDILGFPASEEIFVVVIFWLTLSATAVDATIDAYRYYTGITALQSKIATQKHQHAALKSTAIWYSQEIARVSAALAQLVGKWSRKRKTLKSQQHDSKHILAKLAAVHGEYAGATAAIASLSSKKQLAETACGTAAKRIEELNVQIAEGRRVAASREQLRGTVLSQRTEAVLQLSSTVESTKTDIATLEKSTFATCQANLDVELDAQRTSFKAERARLLAQQRARRGAYEQKLAVLARHVSAGAANLEVTKTTARVTHKTRDGELAAVQARISAASEELRGRRSELADMRAQNDELRIEIGSIKKETATARAQLAQVQAEGTADLASLEAYAAKDRNDLIEHKEALKKQGATLLRSLTVTCRLVENTKESLAFSAAEHKLHMQHCDKERESSVRRLASLQSSLSVVRSAKDAKATEVAAFRSQRDQAKVDHRESLGELGFRLKMVSEGYAGTHDKRRAMEDELKKAKWALEELKNKNRAAVRAYRRSRNVGNSFTENLTKELDNKKALVAALTAAIAEFAHKKGPANIELTIAALEERGEKAEDGLADAYQRLSEKEIGLSRMREELVEVKEAQRKLEEERDDDRRAFNEHLKKTNQMQHRLRRQLVEKKLFHEHQHGELKERLEDLSRPTAALRREAWVESVKNEGFELEGSTNSAIPELLQGSSREGTPGREEDFGQDISSYPVTPTLTYTSRTWSRSPSLSPVLCCPLLE